MHHENEPGVWSEFQCYMFSKIIKKDKKKQNKLGVKFKNISRVGRLVQRGNRPLYLNSIFKESQVRD